MKYPRPLGEKTWNEWVVEQVVISAALRRWRTELQWHEDSLSNRLLHFCKTALNISSNKHRDGEKERMRTRRDSERWYREAEACGRPNTSHSKSLLRSISRDRNERDWRKWGEMEGERQEALQRRRALHLQLENEQQQLSESWSSDGETFRWDPMM